MGRPPSTSRPVVGDRTGGICCDAPLEPCSSDVKAGLGRSWWCTHSRRRCQRAAAAGDDDDDWLHMGRRTRPQGASEPFGPLRARPTVNRPQPQPGVHRARAARIPPGRGFWGTVQRSSTTTKQRTDNMQADAWHMQQGWQARCTHTQEAPHPAGHQSTQCVPARAQHAAPRHMHTKPTAATHTKQRCQDHHCCCHHRHMHCKATRIHGSAEVPNRRHPPLGTGFPGAPPAHPGHPAEPTTA